MFGLGIYQPLAIEPAHYASPIALPEGRSGRVRIVHGTLSGKVPVIGMRQALQRSINPAAVVLRHPLRYHQLVHDDRGVWMTDMPEELFQIAEMLAVVEPRGRVCIGGLGLGILATIIRDRIGVKHATVVEIDPDVIKLAAIDGVEIVCADIVDALETLPMHDYYLLDTWQGTNEGAWWLQVFPLKRIIRRRFGVKPVIHCWAEDIMIGQIASTLVNDRARAWFYRGLPPMGHREATRFCWNVGLPAWEKKYGAIVDETFAQMKKRAKQRKA